MNGKTIISKDFDTFFDTWGEQSEIIEEIPYGSTVTITLLEQPANFEKGAMNVYDVSNYETVGENAVRFVLEQEENTIRVEFIYQTIGDESYASIDTIALSKQPENFEKDKYFN